MRLVLLLDNAYTAAQVRPLLPSAMSGLTVVTSRNQLTGLLVGGAALHRLDPLPPESAVELLARGGGGARVDQDPAAAREVVALCAHLPLAVCLAAAQLAARPHHSVSALAESLARSHGPLDSLQVDGEALVRSALDLSYDLLPPDAALLYRRMGLLPADHYDAFLLRSISSATTGPERVEAAINALIEANLLLETGPGAYRFHDLVRLHASQRGAARDEADQSGDVLRRFAEWCLATATKAESLLTPSHGTLERHPLSPEVQPTPLKDGAEALAWLDRNRVGLMGAVRQSAEAGRHDIAWQLVDAMWPYFHRLRPADWMEAHRTGLTSARAAGSRPGEGRMLTSGAIGLRTAGQYREAARWYGEALQLAIADGDVRQQARALNGLCHVELLTGKFPQARSCFQQALQLRESVSYWRGAALSRIRLGETALAMGEQAEAVRCLTRAQHDLERLDETYESARALALLGHALVDAGQTADGAQRLRAALDVFRQPATRSEAQEGRVLEWLGSAAERSGAPEEARRCYEAARDLFRLASPADAERMDDRLRHR